jgi:hypothetical protein
MIPALPGITAHIKISSPTPDNPDNHHWWPERVVAFTDDGDPLIIGKVGLTTPHGREYSLEDAHGTSDPTDTIIPGGDWNITYFLDGETPYTQPIVAWAISTDGYGKPITTDDTGSLEAVDSHDTEHVVWHPAQTDIPQRVKAIWQTAPSPA